jgi:toxin YoeB
MAADRLAVCHPEFLEDLQHWVQHDRSAARLAANRFLELVSPILCEPFSGMGKPEPLRYFGADVWSLRINQEHRCVYLAKADRVEFLQGRYHY